MSPYRNRQASRTDGQGHRTSRKAVPENATVGCIVILVVRRSLALATDARSSVNADAKRWSRSATVAER